MPQVASKASVYASQHSGVPPRDRMTETNTSPSASPFSMLLDQANTPAPSRDPAPRTTADAPSRASIQRHDAGRAQRPDEGRNTAAAPDAGTPNDDANVAGPESAATEQAGAAGATSEISEETVPSTVDGGDVAKENDATPAAVASAPAIQPSPTATPALAGAPVPATDAPAEGDNVAAPATDLATSPTSTDTDGSTGLPQAPQPGQTATAPHAAHQNAHHGASPHAKPADATATAETPDPSAEPGIAADKLTGNGQEHTDESTSQHPTHTETSSHPSVRSSAPDATERPHIAKPAGDTAPSLQPTLEGTHYVHLQSGRDGTHTIMTTTQVAQTADASNPIASTPVPIEGLAVEIAARAVNGRNRFEIRLDPPELGRIDVRLEIDRSGQVTSRLVVEKAETLDVLRRDAHQLERALQDAGLKTSDNSLQFSLRDQAFAERHDRGGSEGTRTLIAETELPVTENIPLAYGVTLRGGSGIDIRI